MPRYRWLVCLFLVPLALGAAPKTKHVILMTTDGLRPQEVFTGADPALVEGPFGGVADSAAIKAAFWRETPGARREALLPFFWGTIAKSGQVYGNTALGSTARLTNGLKFSYPGYNEMLSGRADPRINSNAKVPNPNVTVLEWLNRKPAYTGKVAAFSGWDVLDSIVNQQRSGIFSNGGWQEMPGIELTVQERLLNRMIRELPRRWPDCRDDAITFPLALEYLRTRRPRVMFIMHGDTDEHAHSGRYDLVLKSAHEFDADLKLLWETLQADPEYRDSTTLIVLTDHGRGDAPDGWKSHGEKVAGAENIWIGILGPDTPALGERSNVAEVTQSQVAATLAAALGEDFRTEFPDAAPPITDATTLPTTP